jgi:hypothetical protein
MDAGVALEFLEERYVIPSAADAMIREWIYPRKI